MSLSKRLRFEILTRDNFTCRYCGGQPPDVKLTVDHVLPAALGGSDDPSNLCAACADCNAGKSSVKPGSPMLEQVTRDAERWAWAISQAAEKRRRDHAQIDSGVAEFDAIWSDWTLIESGERVPRGDDWRTSVERWLVAGLPMDLLKREVEVSMTTYGVRDTWKFFCNRAWRLLEALNDRASDYTRAFAAVDALNDEPELESLKALIF